MSEIKKKTVNKRMTKFKEMTEPEMVQSLEELRREKFNLRIQSKTGQLNNRARVSQIRRDIARILTEQTRRAKAPASK